ncbi:MAG TPA: DOMON-like domain-containing protein [Allosphingosinicella sp.]|nr:DOMON-like domain-containing protein [Allosphingosinicella sp.]
MGKRQHLPVGKHHLVPHPDTPPDSVEAVDVEIYMTDTNEMLLCYRVTASDEVVTPPWVVSQRADKLWETTCFELFLQPAGGPAYFEFNFSPSTEWAAYAFDAYRSGMRNVDLVLDPHVERDPELEPEESSVRFALDADVDLAAIPRGPLRMGLAAVIEEKSGRKSYWALAHPAAKPDFHHPDSFALQLPAE